MRIDELTRSDVPKRKKVIVNILNHKCYDPECAVLAEVRENGFIAVEGKQLYVIADEETRRFLNKDALYFAYKTDYRIKE